MDDIIFVAFGDSLTYGYGVLEEYAYPSRLRADFPHWKIFNEGINGETTREALERLEKDVLSRRPQIVTLLYGSNDSAMTEGQYRPLIEFNKNLRSLTEKITSCQHDTNFNGGKTKLLFITPPSVVDTDFFPFTTNDRVTLYRDCMKQIAKEYDCPIIDFFSALSVKKEEAYQDFFQYDGIHLSNQGYDLLYGLIHEKLQELV